MIFKNLKMELAEESKDRLFYIHFKKDIVFYYSVFNKKSFDKNIKYLLSSQLTFSELVSSKSPKGYSFFMELEEQKAHKKFRRG